MHQKAHNLWILKKDILLLIGPELTSNSIIIPIYSALYHSLIKYAPDFVGTLNTFVLVLQSHIVDHSLALYAEAEICEAEG